jgi:hypothetical protein
MIDSHVPYVAVLRSDLVLLAKYRKFVHYGTCNVIVKRFADKRYAICTGYLGDHRGVSSGVKNTDQFIMRGAHMGVVLPSHYRYERRIDNLYEIQNVS